MTGFVVDVGSEQGLRRRDGAYRNRRMLFLDTTPVYTRCRASALAAADPHAAIGELPLRERRLLLRSRRCSGPSCWRSRRVPSVFVSWKVRVVIGLQALCSAMGEAEAARDLPQDDAAIARQVAESDSDCRNRAFRQQITGSCAG
jgi:hypothetical protein